MTEFHALKEPPWLLAKVDQRVAEMKDAISSSKAFEILGADMLVMPLSEPREGATRQQMQMWEKTCDNCEKYCPGGLNTGFVRREWDGHPLQIFFGACPRCLPVPS